MRALTPTPTPESVAADDSPGSVTETAADRGPAERSEHAGGGWMLKPLGDLGVRTAWAAQPRAPPSNRGVFVGAVRQRRFVSAYGLRATEAAATNIVKYLKPMPDTGKTHISQ